MGVKKEKAGGGSLTSTQSLRETHNFITGGRGGEVMSYPAIDDHGTASARLAAS